MREFVGNIGGSGFNDGNSCNGRHWQPGDAGEQAAALEPVEGEAEEEAADRVTCTAAVGGNYESN